MKRILIVASTHGHERIGLRVIDELKKLEIDHQYIEMVVGNPRASELDIPFIESDLNRVFPGHADGDYEQQRACELYEKIQQYDIVIDLHSTNTTDLGADSMVIVTRDDKETKGHLDVIMPPRTLVMRYQSQGALIAHAKIGIAFEYGKDDSETVLAATLHDIAKLLVHTGALEVNPYPSVRPTTETSVYEVYDAYGKDFSGSYTLDKNVKNFSLLEKGTLLCTSENGEAFYANESFIPILFGENRYADIFGFKARQIS